MRIIDMSPLEDDCPGFVIKCEHHREIEDVARIIAREYEQISGGYAMLKSYVERFPSEHNGFRRHLGYDVRMANVPQFRVSVVAGMDPWNIFEITPLEGISQGMFLQLYAKLVG